MQSKNFEARNGDNEDKKIRGIGMAMKNTPKDHSYALNQNLIQQQRPAIQMQME